jgi:hypothetical protein
MASAWPEPPSVKPAGVHDGVEAFAFITTETPPETFKAFRNPMNVA